MSLRGYKIDMRSHQNHTARINSHRNISTHEASSDSPQFTDGVTWSIWHRNQGWPWFGQTKPTPRTTVCWWRSGYTGYIKRYSRKISQMTRYALVIPRYVLVNALNLRAAAVAVILTKAAWRALNALKEVLPCENGPEEMTLWVLAMVVQGALSDLKESEENGREGLALQVLTKAVREASSDLKVFPLRQENRQEHMSLQRSYV